MGIDRRRRASLALTLNFLALFLAVSALGTSHWCAGTRKVVKPFCTGPVTTKQSFCIRFNSSNLNDTRLVQYIWETGEDKYVMRKFHTGIWFSCEQNINMTGKLFSSTGRSLAAVYQLTLWCHSVTKYSLFHSYNLLRDPSHKAIAQHIHRLAPILILFIQIPAFMHFREAESSQKSRIKNIWSWNINFTLQLFSRFSHYCLDLPECFFSYCTDSERQALLLLLNTDVKAESQCAYKQLLIFTFAPVDNPEPLKNQTCMLLQKIRNSTGKKNTIT